MRFTLPLLLMIVANTASVALAEEIETGPVTVPWKTVIYQAINVAIMIIGLVYVLKAPVRKYFKEKRASFLQEAQKAENARRAAEEERMQIQVRLQKLESTAEESVARARADAADMKKQMIADAEAISKRIQKEAEEAARLEVERAKNQLREMLVNESISMARSQMDSKVSADDQKRLQTHFIQNIQVVQK